MKKLILSLYVIATTLCASAQNGGQPSSVTLYSGTYNGSDYTGPETITIAPNATVIINGDISLADGYYIKLSTGSSLSFPHGYKSNTPFNIVANSTLSVSGVLDLKSSNTLISGTLTTNDFTVEGASITMSNCGFIKTTDFHFSTDNILSGSGLLYITGVYDNQGGDGWSGHSLTQSNHIFINNNTTLNVGTAQHTTSTGACSTVTPVIWSDFSMQRNLNDSALVTVSWQTLTESNIKNYTLEASVDGSNYDSVKSIAPNNGGNSSTAQTYSITYTDPLIIKVIEAGFGLLGSLLIIGLIVSYATKKHKVLGAICAVVLVICMVSCSKSVNQPKVLKYKYFRVVETDLDGTKTYSQVMHG